MIKLGIVDYDPQFLEGFATYFNGKSYVSELIIFTNTQHVRKHIKNKKRIDYLFLDYETSAPASLTFIGEIKNQSRQTEIVVLSKDSSKDIVIRSFVAGASGFLPKSLPLEEMEDQLRNIIKGGAAITPQIAKELVTYFNPGPKKLSNATLNEKEHIIIRLMTDGHDYKEIARLMEVSGHSVRYYMKQIYKKMNVKSKGAAIKMYMLNNKF